MVLARNSGDDGDSEDELQRMVDMHSTPVAEYQLHLLKLEERSASMEVYYLDYRPSFSFIFKNKK